MESISLIIPNYNGAALLEKNIPHVIKALEVYKERSKGSVELIVIDDASTDNSHAVLSSLEEQNRASIPFSVINNEKNLGFSGAVNKAAKKAVGSLIVLLNTDVTPTEDFLLPLVPHFENGAVFAVGCLDKSVENGKIVERGRGIARWRKGLYIHSAGNLTASTTAWVSGGSGIFRRSMWEGLRGFNTLFSPYYWEDIDLSYRARKAGYTILFEKRSVVTHRHEEGAIRTSSTKKNITLVAYRNQFIFIWSNLTEGKQWILHLAFLPWHVMKALVSGDTLFLGGLLQACIKIPRIIQKRRQMIRSVKTDSDLQIFS